MTMSGVVSRASGQALFDGDGRLHRISILLEEHLLPLQEIRVVVDDQ